MARAWLYTAIILSMSLAGCVGGTGQPHAQEADTAHALVLDCYYADLSIQVDYMEGYRPSRDALQTILDVTSKLTSKHTTNIADVRILPSNSTNRQGTYWTLDEVEAVHNASFRLGNPRELGNGTNAFLHLLSLDSQLRYSRGGETVLAGGVELKNVIAVFGDATGSSGGAGSQLIADSTGWDSIEIAHELGHALGLLNLGAPMVRDHALPGDPNHSRNPQSVMYAGGDTRDGATHLLHDYSSKAVDLFDQDDLADLAALRAETC